MKRYVRVATVVVLVLVFGAAGVAKLASAASFEEQFAHFGLPNGWVYLTGAVELLGAALVAFPIQALRKVGAALLAATIAVATALHLLNDPVALALPAFVLMLLAAYVSFTPRSETARRGLAVA